MSADMSVVSSPSLQFNMEIRPDIGLAIEDFILYSRLGLKNEAYDLLRGVLWQHILFFPVFAEIALFLVTEGELHDLRSVLELLHHGNYATIFEEEEIRFTRCFEPIRRVQISKQTSLKGFVLGKDLLRNLQQLSGCSSPLQAQTILLKLHVLSSLSTFEEVSDVAYMDYKFLYDEKFLWESTAILEILCTKAADQKTYTQPIHVLAELEQLYHKIMKDTGADEALAIAVTEIKTRLPDLLCILSAKMSMLSVLHAFEKDGFGPNGLKILQILEEAVKLMRTVMLLLPHADLGGRHWETLKIFAQFYGRETTQVQDLHLPAPRTAANEPIGSSDRHEPDIPALQNNKSATQLQASETRIPSSVTGRHHIGILKESQALQILPSRPVLASRASKLKSWTAISAYERYTNPNTFTSIATASDDVARWIETTLVDDQKPHELTTSKPARLVSPDPSNTGNIQISRSELPDILERFLDLGYHDFSAIHSFLSFEKGIWEVDTNELLQLIARCIEQSERHDLLRLAQRYVLLTPSFRTASKLEQRKWISSLPSNQSSQEELKKACDVLLQVLDEAAKQPHQKQSRASLFNQHKSSQSNYESQGWRSVDGSPSARATSPLSDLDSPLDHPKGRLYPEVTIGPSATYVPSEIKALLFADYKVPYGEKQIHQVFGVGNMFGVFWHENFGHNPPNALHNFKQDPKQMEPRAYVTMANNGEYIFSHVKRFIVVKARQSFCIALPVTSYSKRGLSAKNIASVEHRAHGIVYDQLSTPTLLDGENPFTKDPIRFEMVEGEHLTKSSRICYAKPHTIEYNIKVKHMGVMWQDHINTFLVAFRNELLPVLPTQ